MFRRGELTRVGADTLNRLAKELERLRPFAGVPEQVNSLSPYAALSRRGAEIDAVLVMSATPVFTGVYDGVTQSYNELTDTWETDGECYLIEVNNQALTTVRYQAWAAGYLDGRKVYVTKADGVGAGSTTTFTGPVTFNGSAIFNGGLSWTMTHVTWAAQQNDYALLAETTTLAVTLTGDQTLTGIAAPDPPTDRVLWIINVDDANVLSLAHLSVSSTVGNLISCPGGVTFTLAPRNGVGLQYDSQDEVWRFLDDTGLSNHELLSGTHTDTLADAVVSGDLIYGNATPLWARMAIGTSGQVLTSVGGFPEWADPSSGFTAKEIDGTPTSSTEVQFPNTSLDTSGAAVVVREADLTHVGLVNTSNQSFAGEKGFTNRLWIERLGSGVSYLAFGGPGDDPTTKTHLELNDTNSVLSLYSTNSGPAISTFSVSGVYGIQFKFITNNSTPPSIFINWNGGSEEGQTGDFGGLLFTSGLLTGGSFTGGDIDGGAF